MTDTTKAETPTSDDADADAAAESDPLNRV